MFSLWSSCNTLKHTPLVESLGGTWERKNNIGREIGRNPFQIEIRGWRGRGKMNGKTTNKNYKRSPLEWNLKEKEGERLRKLELGLRLERDLVNWELRKENKNGRLDAVYFIRDTLSGERLERSEERVYPIMGWIHIRNGPDCWEYPFLDFFFL